MLRHRAPLALALLVFVPMACLEKDCGPRDVDCESDASCPANSICQEDADGCGDRANLCVAVTECTSNDDCPLGEACTFRPGVVSEQPFERTAPDRGVCGCFDEECVLFAAAAAAGATASASSSVSATSASASSAQASSASAGTAVSVSVGGTGGLGGAGEGGALGAGGDGGASGPGGAAPGAGGDGGRPVGSGGGGGR